MRIITGSARGTGLMTLDGDATRPTPEKVKEAVFSMIQFELEGSRILDLFSGSGQLGLEALSRGAEYAVLADSSPDAVEIIKKNAIKTHLFNKCSVLRSEYKNTVRAFSGRDKFDIIFLDPPFAQHLIPEVLKRIADAGITADGGKIICESEDDIIYEAEGFECVKHVKYGRIFITVLSRPLPEI